jgi:hypothetical protein
MNEDRLKTLIERADSPPPKPATVGLELAERVCILHRQRQRRKLMLAAAAAVAVGVVPWLLPGGRPGHEVATSSPKGPLAPSRAVMRNAREEIEREEGIVERLLVTEKRRRLAAISDAAKSNLDGPSFLAEQVGEAAMAVLLSGEQRAEHPERVPAAKEDYACVIRNFPNTIWATQAEARLAALKP